MLSAIVAPLLLAWLAWERREHQRWVSDPARPWSVQEAAQRRVIEWTRASYDARAVIR